MLEDNKVIIKSSGTYAVTGILEDGQLVVDAEEKSDKEFERFGMSENTTDEETEGDISTKGIKAGTSTETTTNGLYTDGTYSGGSEIGNTTVETVVTTIGTVTNGMGSQGGMMKPGGGQGGQKPENMGTPPEGNQGIGRHKN